MRRSVVIGVVLCVGALLVPATVSGAASRGPSRTTARATAVRATAARTKAAASRLSRADTPPSPPTLSAEPSSALDDGQPVAVTADGLTAKTTYILLECQSTSTDLTGCDPSTAVPEKTDSTGTFSTTYAVTRFITPEDSLTPTSTDCAQSDACILAVSSLPTIGGTLNEPLLADTPIGFADVAVVPPTVTADPSTGLLDDQKINVSGTGYSPRAPIFLTECQTPPNDANCDLSDLVTLIPADTSGDFSVSYRVTRVINLGTGPIDCAEPDACELMATDESNPDEAASVPIGFADVPIKTPVMTATPSTNLDDGQDVTVTGKDFRPRDPVLMSECPAGATNAGDCVLEAGIGDTGGVLVNGSGRFSLTFNVARVLTLYDGTIDCADPPGCVIGAVDENDLEGSVEATAALTFNPKVPPLPPLNLVLHVDPHGQIVAGASKRNSAEITGTISCDRTKPVPVAFLLQLTEPVGPVQAGGAIEGEATCGHAGAPFTATISSAHRPSKSSFVPGVAGVLLEVYGDSGSSTQETTASASVTLKASTSAPDR